MNRFILFAALAICLPLAAQTDDTSLHAKAQQAVLALHIDRMVKQVAGDFTKQYRDTAEHIAGNTPTPEQAAKLAEFQKNLSQTIDLQLGWDAIGPGFADLYAKNFTEAQLDAIIAFYKSPAGIAFLDKTPALNTQTAQLLHAKMVALQPQLKQSLDEFRKTAQAPPPASAQQSAPSAIAPK